MAEYQIVQLRLTIKRQHLDTTNLKTIRDALLKTPDHCASGTFGYAKKKEVITGSCMVFAGDDGSVQIEQNGGHGDLDGILLQKQGKLYAVKI